MGKTGEKKRSRRESSADDDTAPSRASEEAAAAAPAAPEQQAAAAASDDPDRVVEDDDDDASAAAAAESGSESDSMGMAGVPDGADMEKVAPATGLSDARLPAVFAQCFQQSNGRLVDPTAVQAHCWPAMLAGRDVLAIASTGSGKTVAYALPALSHVLDQSKTAAMDQVLTQAERRRSPRVLVLVPTRELAKQVQSTVHRLCGRHHVASLAAYGGKDRAEQVDVLRENNVEVVVATPGRALDLLDASDMELRRTTLVVIDECDRMLDLGFEPQIRKVFAVLRKNDGSSKKKDEKDGQKKKKKSKEEEPDSEAESESESESSDSESDSDSETEEEKLKKRKKKRKEKKRKKKEKKEKKKKKKKKKLEEKPEEEKPRNRKTQFVMLSATFPKRVRALVGALHLLAHEPYTLQVHPDGEVSTRISSNEGGKGGSYTSAISASIKQIVQVCAEHKKPRKLLKFLEKVEHDDAAQARRHKSAVLIFCTRIKTVLFVQKLLQDKGKAVSALHGGIPQRERERALINFKSGKGKLLVATDVAGRGIDIKGLPYVVNYDFPASLEVYAHRIGRTGRQERPGTAVSFFTRNFAPMATDLVALLNATSQSVDSYLLQLTAPQLGDEGEAAARKSQSKKRDRKRRRRDHNKAAGAQDEGTQDEGKPSASATEST